MLVNPGRDLHQCGALQGGLQQFLTNCFKPLFGAQAGRLNGDMAAQGQGQQGWLGRWGVKAGPHG
jgi:hypothetical protein